MRDVSFRNGAVKLSGSLLLPKNPGPHPAILFLHGSGPESRWPSHYLAERFARAGIAALIYDKRGVGQSTGDWQKAGFEDLATDALAGIHFLQTLPEINRNKIGIFGHSQGGMLAPLVAERTPLAFVIGSAASGIDPAELEEYSIGNSIGLLKLTQQDAANARAFMHALVDTGYRGKPRADLDAIAARFKGRPWYFEPPPPGNYLWAFMRSIELSRPQAAWQHVKAPVLLLYGAQDERVPPIKSSDAIIAMLHASGNRDVTLKMFSGADHTFSLQTTNGGWHKRVPDYTDIIVSWAVTKVK
jgi:dipeptidyl aminopeptidase/acylaminoacyl peptidase